MTKSTFNYSEVARETVNCPVCTHARHDLVFDRDRYGMGIHTVICTQCGFVFTNPRPTEAALNEFYSYHYRNYYEQISVPTDEYLNKGRFHERALWNLDFIRPDIEALLSRENNISFLDVGCAQGSLLKLLHQTYGPKVDLHGIEPSRDFSAYARRHSQATIFTGILDEYISRRSDCLLFDYVNLSHVLEHILQPVEFLKCLHGIIKPGGRLCVEIPNILGDWSGIGMFHIGHVSQFSPETFKRAASAAGFGVLSEDLSGNAIHPWKMTYLLQRVSLVPDYPFPTEADIRLWAAEIRARANISLWARLKNRLLVGVSSVLSRHTVENCPISHQM